jgi:hypothetical protein
MASPKDFDRLFSNVDFADIERRLVVIGPVIVDFPIDDLPANTIDMRKNKNGVWEKQRTSDGPNRSDD